MMLKRYGVVFRDLLVRESNLPKWRELQIAFRRLEARGEIRGGRFVDGFLGEQFALPVAVESLRATRKLPPSGEVVTISAADPLNLVGIVVTGERIPAISGRLLAAPMNLLRLVARNCTSLPARSSRTNVNPPEVPTPGIAGGEKLIAKPSGILLSSRFTVWIISW